LFFSKKQLFQLSIQNNNTKTQNARQTKKTNPIQTADFLKKSAVPIHTQPQHTKKTNAKALKKLPRPKKN
jgi:hypothetical protein